jgi:hypothetical protein
VGLKSYFQRPGDGRVRPHIPARHLVWAVVIGHVLRVVSFLRLEWLAHSPVRAESGIKRQFGDDALAYCSERMDPEATRLALASALHQAKRNKAFENSRFIGLALDGTGAGCTHKEPCRLCDPVPSGRERRSASRRPFRFSVPARAGRYSARPKLPERGVVLGSGVEELERQAGRGGAA